MLVFILIEVDGIGVILELGVIVVENRKIKVWIISMERLYEEINLIL